MNKIQFIALTKKFLWISLPTSCVAYMRWFNNFFCTFKRDHRMSEPVIFSSWCVIFFIFCCKNFTLIVYILGFADNFNRLSLTFVYCLLQDYIQGCARLWGNSWWTFKLNILGGIQKLWHSPLGCPNCIY